jgi:anaerobic selenocysteine-containing dehydrogenase
MPDSQTKPSRRGFLWGAAATGAAAATVAALPQVRQAAQAPVAETPPVPERGGGYRLSEHVKHYYQTTRI